MAYTQPLYYDNAKEDEANPYGGNNILSQGSSQIVPNQQGGSLTPNQPRTGSVGGGTFSDISRYLTQNQAGSQRLAEKIGQNINAQGIEARKGLAEAQQNFLDQMNQNTIGINQDILGKVITNPYGYGNQPQSGQGTKEPRGGKQQGQIVTPDVYYGGRQKSPQDASGVVTDANNPMTYLSQAKGKNALSPQSSSAAPSVDAALPAIPGMEGMTPDQILAEFAKMRDATYQGPLGLSDLEGYNDLMSKFSAAGEAGGQTESEIGRMEALRNLYENPMMGEGAARLDNLLLQSQGAKDALSRGRENISDLPGVLETAATKAGEEGQAAKQKTENTSWAAKALLGLGQDDTWTEEEAAKLKDLLGENSQYQSLADIASQGGLYGQFNTGLSDRLEQARADYTKQANTAQKELAAASTWGASHPENPIPPVSDSTLQALGISRNQWNDFMQQSYNLGGQGIQGPNINEYASYLDPSVINYGNILNDEDQARMAALNQLMGTEGQFPGGEQYYPYNDLVDFNLENFQNDLQQLLSGYGGGY